MRLVGWTSERVGKLKNAESEASDLKHGDKTKLRGLTTLSCTQQNGVLQSKKDAQFLVVIMVFLEFEPKVLAA